MSQGKTLKMILQWNSEGSEEISHLGIGEWPSGWRNSKWKGPARVVWPASSEGGRAVVAGQSEQGKEEAFTREATKPSHGPDRYPSWGLKTPAQDPRQVGSCLLPTVNFQILSETHFLFYALLFGSVTLGLLLPADWIPSSDRGSLRACAGFCGSFRLSFWPCPTAFLN